MIFHSMLEIRHPNYLISVIRGPYQKRDWRDIAEREKERERGGERDSTILKFMVKLTRLNDLFASNT